MNFLRRVRGWFGDRQGAGVRQGLRVPTGPGVRGDRGLTLLEMILVCAMTGLLLGLLFAIFFQGARAWRLSDARSDLQGQAGLLLHGLMLEAQQASASSLSLEGEALSFLSARDLAGQFRTDDLGQPLWQQAVIYYRDPEGAVRRRALPLAPPGGVPRPIQQLDLGSGPEPLSSYLSEGQVAARGVESFQPSMDGPGLLRVTLTLSQQVRSEQTTVRELTASVLVRNH